MGKKLLIATIVLTICTGISSADAQKKQTYKHTVVLDAGHGGHDTGAIGKKGKEKDVVLSIALKVGDYIKKNTPDTRVIYTRDDDFFVPLDERAAIANKNNADLFVSIHANSNKNSKPFGTETFAMGLHKSQSNLDVAQKENSVIVLEQDYNTKYEGFDPSSAESYIIFSLMQNVYLDKSLKLASMVQDEFREKAKRADRGVKQAGFLVLWHTKMPSVLIETGFISNEEEEKYLMSANGQDYLASAIFRAIRDYLASLEAEEREVKKATTVAQDDTEAAPTESALCYRLQVATTSAPVANPIEKFPGKPDIFEYKDGNKYKYMIGRFATLDEASAYKKTISAEYPDAFIVPFNNGKKISMSEAKKLEKK
ncbi:MAG: N-acetylmuramoyl-L-alanine amidase [Salinivirgaceae bacterium]|nr:N-acetylmuramoyl-L-alanine amidase [Salinivirgaceae bacterium]